MKLTLHIGTEKTGTTSIQEFLVNNRQLLSDFNIYSPQSLSYRFGQGNHVLLPFMISPESFEHDIWIGGRQWIGKGRQLNYFLSRARRKLALEFENASHSSAHWVISSELLHSRIVNTRYIVKLKEFLDLYFSDIEILVYLRRPIDTAVSSYSTAVQSGCYLPDLPGPDNPYLANLCNHEATIKRWSLVFSDSNVNVRLYQKNSFIGGDLINDFCHQIHFSGFSQAQYSTAKANSSASALGIALISHYNGIRPRNLYWQYDPAHSEFRRFAFSRTKNLPRFLPSTKTVELYNAAFQSSDNWIRENYYPEKQDLWDDQSDFSEFSGNVHGEFYSRAETAVLFDLVTSLWLQQKYTHSFFFKCKQALKRIKLSLVSFKIFLQ